MQGADPTTRWLRHRSRSGPTERPRDTPGRSDRGECPPMPRRIQANASCWCRAGPTPDTHYRSKPFDCASIVEIHNRDTVLFSEGTADHRERVAAVHEPQVEPPIG